MKQLILDVLEDMSNDQINLASETARETIANIIVATIRTNKGWYLDLNHSKKQEEEDKKMIESHMTEEWKARETWVCDICGENTFDVDWDYIGSGTNHLGCELRLEQDENYRKKNWSQKKHEDKVFDEYAEDIDEQAFAQGRESSKDDLQKQVYMEMTTDGLPEGGDSQAVRDSKVWVDKFTEEIVTDNDTGYIY